MYSTDEVNALLRDATPTILEALIKKTEHAWNITNNAELDNGSCNVVFTDVQTGHAITLCAWPYNTRLVIRPYSRMSPADKWQASDFILPETVKRENFLISASYHINILKDAAYTTDRVAMIASSLSEIWTYISLPWLDHQDTASVA